MKKFVVKYRKPFIITLGIMVLNFTLGFDIRFTIINILWLLA